MWWLNSLRENYEVSPCRNSKQDCSKTPDKTKTNSVHSDQLKVRGQTRKEKYYT